MARRESPDAVAVEGVKDEDNDRQIDEGEDQRRVGGEQRRTRSRFGTGHLKDHRFSSRSVANRSEMVINRMQADMAAPSGQS